ncbi:1-acyl-sn-glycerol-3-phosphate acyltransferase [Streptomyces enissocaesilis]|uniref:Phospholipid/glycerol acyltransferase domain-containing protein n=1 Tax=Streptomyces enissocaesilis TaxID=332589 RepID=A0ABP6J4L5_9ACTN
MFQRRRSTEVDTVLRHPHASHEILALAQRTGVDATVARRRVRRCLREMVTVRGTPWTGLFTRVMCRALVPSWEVNILEEDRRMLLGPAATDACLIFLPQHRAYTDPLFVSLALRDIGRPRPLWFAGDNLRLPLIASLAARAGVVFLRRASPADEDYRSALRLYLRHLVGSGETLEWYQEGGRSRTGLPGPPRHGLLEHTLAAVRDMPGSKVWLVPVALSFSSLPDATALAREGNGQAKRPESLRWFLRYLQAQHRTRGVVHVRFAAPLSVDDFVEHARGTLSEPTATRIMAREVSRAHCRVTPVTGQTLVALAVSAAGHWSTTAQVHQRAQPLLDSLERSDAPTLDTEDLRTEQGVRRALLCLRDVGAVSLTGTDASVSEAGRGLPPVLRAHVREHRAVATFYRNQGIHWLWPRAAAEVAALRAARVTPMDAWDAAVQELRSVLTAAACGTGLGVESSLLATGVVELKRLATSTDGTEEGLWTFPIPLTPAEALIAPDVLSDASAGQLVAFQELAREPDSHTIDPDVVLPRILARARTRSNTIGSASLVPPHAPGFYHSLLLDARRSGLLETGLDAARRRRHAHAEARQLHADLMTIALIRRTAKLPPVPGRPGGDRP